MRRFAAFQLLLASAVAVGAPLPEPRAAAILEAGEHSPSTLGRSTTDRSNARVASGAFGSIGLLHLSSADLGSQGIVRLSVLGEHLPSWRDFPVRGASNVRSALGFSASFTPLDFLETYLAYQTSANTNSTTTPALIQAMGDVKLGVKAAREWLPGLFAGGELRLASFSAIGNQGFARGAFGIQPSAVLSYDSRREVPSVPMRLHANLGAAIDDTASLVAERRLNTAEEFALNVNAYHRLTVGLGAEFPLPFATPIVEYAFAHPLGVPASGLAGPDGLPVSPWAAMTQTLTLGARITALRDVSFLLAADLGMTRKVARGLAATQPFNLFLGAAFHLDPFGRGGGGEVVTVGPRPDGTQLPAPLPPPERPQTGRISGLVADAATSRPIPGAIVSMLGTGMPPVASDPQTGRFMSHELPVGTVRLLLQREGYKDGRAEIVVEPGKVAALEVKLESLARRVRVSMSATSNRQPIGAQIHFRGPEEQRIALPAGIPTPLRTELPAGKYVVVATADGYLAQLRELDVADGAELTLGFALVPEPKKRLVVLKEEKIELLKPLRFVDGKAALAPESSFLMQQVVDAFVRGNVKRLRIEGHTDNRGPPDANLRLSQDRANAVAEQLASLGIARSRLEAAGFGHTRPIAPNLTARGRELNRRVDFVIIEK
jgi:OmpA-OmpF porin, OOP family